MMAPNCTIPTDENVSILGLVTANLIPDYRKYGYFYHFVSLTVASIKKVIS